MSVEEVEQGNGGKVLPLADARKEKLKKNSPAPVGETARQRFMAMENHVCELATAAELAIDIYAANPHSEPIGPKTAWVLDQIERLANELRAMYYGEDED